MKDDERYDNPVDGKTYVAPGGWKLYHPDSPAQTQPDTNKVSIHRLRLLTAQKDAAARTKVEELAQFTKKVEHQAQTLLTKSDRAFELLVQFKCTPSGHEVQMSHQGEVNQRLLQDFYDALTTLEKLRVKQDD